MRLYGYRIMSVNIAESDDVQGIVPPLQETHQSKDVMLVSGVVKDASTNMEHDDKNLDVSATAQLLPKPGNL